MSRFDTFYSPNTAIMEDYGLHALSSEILIETAERFHIGQSYTPENAVKLRCKLCAGDRFEIAWDDYYVAVRCAECKWEYCIAQE